MQRALKSSKSRTGQDLDKAFKDLAERLQLQRRMTHAGIVVTAAAILDVQLERALKYFMRPLSKGTYDRLFGSFRPLQPFSSKVIVAHALGIIPPETFRQLERIRQIRNEFAHSSTLLNFGSPSVQPFVQALRSKAAHDQRPEAIFMAAVEAANKVLERYLARKGGRKRPGKGNFSG